MRKEWYCLSKIPLPIELTYAGNNQITFAGLCCAAFEIDKNSYQFAPAAYFLLYVVRDYID